MRSGNKFAICSFVLLLVGAACATSDTPAPPTTAAAEFVDGPCAATPHPVPALQGARCGELVVPVHRGETGDATMRLAVAVIPSQTQPPIENPIVFLMGGPGQDAIADPPINPDYPLNRTRDLILMGQRGNLTSSTPMACPEIDRFYARRVGLPYNAPSTGTAYVGAVRECHDRLAPTTDLTAFNSTESAEDLIALRQALGIEKWNVFSHSYGTDLGLIYLRHDADAVESIVFDGVTPPSVAALGWTWASAEDAFDAMIAACAAQPPCAARYPDLEATFLRLVGELEANPLTTTVDVPGVGPTAVVVDGGMLLNWFVPVATHLPADFPAAIDALAHGDPGLVASQWAAAWTNPDKVGFLAWGLTLSIWCREWVPFETVDDQLDQAIAAFPEFPESVLAQAPQLPFLREGCQAWNVPKAPDSIRDITSSDVPALVLSGSYDGQTGPVWGDYIAKDLSRSTVVVVPGAAHGVYAEPCGGEIIAAFFDNPDKPDTACAETTRPPDYTISPPGP